MVQKTLERKQQETKDAQASIKRTQEDARRPRASDSYDAMVKKQFERRQQDIADAQKAVLRGKEEAKLAREKTPSTFDERQPARRQAQDNALKRGLEGDNQKPIKPPSAKPPRPTPQQSRPSSGSPPAGNNSNIATATKTQAEIALKFPPPKTPPPIPIAILVGCRKIGCCLSWLRNFGHG